MPFLSIIIPTCNRNASLALCLDRLQPGAQSLEAHHYEVIVSDDGKDNGAKTLIEQQYPWAQWIAGPKKGPAANRNNGASLAQGEWLVFTDDDCLPDAHWLSAYEKAIREHPDSKAFEGAILPDDWDLLKKDMAECPVNTTGGCFWSANIMVEKKLFDEIGGFDEQFRIAAQEDQDIFIRVKEKTIVHFVLKARIEHPVRRMRYWKKIRQSRHAAHNYLLFAKKHQDKNHQRRYLIWKGGIKAQGLACIAAVRKMHFRFASVCLYTLLFVYTPKFVFGK